MPIEVKFPSVGESITEGTLGLWSKKPGDYVSSGEQLGEIETDKVTSEIFADANGVFQPVVEEGETIEVGQVLATIDATASPPPKTKESSTSAGAAADEAVVASVSPVPVAASQAEPAAPTANGSGKAEFLSPAVRTLIEEFGLDAGKIPGSGKDGRILKSDVLAALQELQKAVLQGDGRTRSSGETAGASAGARRTTRKKMSSLRKRIAERLVSAQQEAALLTTFNEVDMSQIITLRKLYKERFLDKHGVKLGFMSFFVKAAVYALKEVPSVNTQLDGEEVIQNAYYDIGVAIATDKGLLVPVLRQPDVLDLAGIEASILDYAKKARGGKITLPDLEGGVFTITNGGTFGSMLSTPLLNPPQCGILGMHAITERPVAVNGRVEIRPMMYLALTYDHRLVDGKEAVTFLVRVKEFIENPSLALLDL